MDYTYYMKIALREAQEAFTQDEVPVGVVIVCNNKIIAKGRNLTEMLKDPTAHAEIQAITAATEFLGAKYLTDCTLFVTLEPCVMCAGALFWSQIGTVVYGASDEKRGFRSVNENILHPKTQLIGGILELECAALMKDFFKKKR